MAGIPSQVYLVRWYNLQVSMFDLVVIALEKVKMVNNYWGNSEVITIKKGTNIMINSIIKEISEPTYQ